MKLKVRPLALSALFTLMVMPVFGQLFPQPQPYMYDRGYEAFAPLPGVKRMCFNRYIAGARFPNGWDVLVESYSYDAAGHITQWNRYQNITGEATLQTTFAWAPEGYLTSENILLASDHSEMYRNYTWEKDGSGKLTKANIVDKVKKPIATLEATPDGGWVHTDVTIGNGKFQRSTYDAQNRLLRMENTASGLVEEYSYLPNRMLQSVSIKNPNGTTTKIQYDNKLDEKGRVIAQTESGRGTPKTYYFKYDTAGNMIEKGIIPNQPLELRGYDPMGRLTDVLTFDMQGLPKEVLNITYECYSK